ncbi:MAG: hypothetical protein RBT63_07675 [Bdellovibrionales bacterium]|jgi:hypothetical protein|nr:hypothetical protein [Bdellovibrionales bacterium]
MKKFAFALLALSTSAWATPAPFFQDNGSASFTLGTQNNTEFMETIETRYFHFTYPDHKLVRATVTNKTLLYEQGTIGKVALEVRGNARSRFDKVLWRRSEVGNHVEITLDDFVSVVEYGCCATPDTTHLLDIETGKKIEAATSKILTIVAPNTKLKNRYIAAVIDSNAPQKLGDRSYLGTFSYFDNTRIISRVRVYADLPSDWGAMLDEPEVIDLTPEPAQGSRTETRGLNVTLWGSDGIESSTQAFKGFAIESSTSYANQDEVVRIVINGDQFSEQLSSTSPGLTLQFVK